MTKDITNIIIPKADLIKVLQEAYLAGMHHYYKNVSTVLDKSFQNYLAADMPQKYAEGVMEGAIDKGLEYIQKKKDLEDKLRQQEKEKQIKKSGFQIIKDEE